MDAGRAATEAGNLDEALEQIESALALAREEPSSPSAIGSSLNALGAVMMRLGRYDDALRYLQEARERLSAVFGADHPEAIPPLNNLAGVYGELGRYDEALDALRKTIAIEGRQYGERSAKVALTRIRLGNALTRSRRWPEAELEYRAAIDLLESSDDPDSAVQLRGALSGLGNVYREMGKLDEAYEALTRAGALRPSGAGQARGEDAAAKLNLGATYLSAGRYEEGLKLLREGLRDLEGFLAPDHPQVATVHLNIGTGEARLGRMDRAEASFAEACRIYSTSLPDAHPDVERCLKNHAQALSVLGREEEAAAVRRRIVPPAPGP
jgi:tetratricopeptide (TPR) repeat protein